LPTLLEEKNFDLNDWETMPHTLNSHVPPQQNSNKHHEYSDPIENLPDSTYSNNGKTPAPILAESSDDWSYATQELLDALPRVWTRGLLYFLVAFATIVLPWAMLSKVDETGSARGRLEPKGKTIRLDAPVAGTVAAIQVKEGEAVKTGQSLLSLESELVSAELQQAQAKLDGQLNRVTQLKVIKNQLEIAIRTQRLQSQAQESEQLAQINQTQQRLNSVRKLYPLEQNRQQLAHNDVQRYQGLFKAGAVAKVKVEEAERAMIESQRQIEQVQSDIKQAQAELEKQQSAYERVVRTGELTILESQRQLEDLQSQIVGLQSEIAQTNNQLESLQFQLQQRVLRAPITGMIFQLPIQRAGAVVQPGQMIAQIAPQGIPLVLRAQMAPQQSGFLRKGMQVKIKFDAYPFQDYGVVEGRLSWVSPDSKIIETDKGKIETFELEVTLDKPYIQTVKKRIVLTPGQTATAEVIVRQRRVIDFILDPFKKLQKGGLEL
jgi:HlyD family secretion protein